MLFGLPVRDSDRNGDDGEARQRADGVHSYFAPCHALSRVSELTGPRPFFFWPHKTAPKAVKLAKQLSPRVQSTR